ncbi:MAG TPA: hypothetical protein VF503_25420 [Sphingobium sp.]|uniref:hypothetical protein n=1 Tax=Sphingobium sp. TaxID=1912891 RepID=UPI002ED20356
MNRFFAILSALFFACAAIPAQANGLGIEGNYGRADGSWGAELGAGYGIGVGGGFKLTPGAGVFLRDGGARVYGRAEATYTLPASATFGMGVRISDERTRPYATLSFPVLPKVAIKGNAWSKYYTLGLTVGY